MRAILFDFDGTIADTQEAFLTIVNRLAPEFGYPPVDQAQLAYLKTLSSGEVIRYARISPLKIPFILKRLKKELGKTITELQPYPGMASMLTALKSQDYFLGIVTSNSLENVSAFLAKNELDGIFDVIHSGTTLFGKNRIINRLLRERRLPAETVIYVGDETRDVVAAQKSHITMVAVGWGFNSPGILMEYHPDYLIYHPQELLAILKDQYPISAISYQSS
ncbi:MAG: HAD hydrolase-like protein [Cyanobacteriota bacterium]|nr:HAD hydrolase-like protein [Cyanobacteriota bacterium]